MTPDFIPIPQGKEANGNLPLPKGKLFRLQSPEIGWDHLGKCWIRQARVQVWALLLTSSLVWDRLLHLLTVQLLYLRNRVHLVRWWKHNQVSKTPLAWGWQAAKSQYLLSSALVTTELFCDCPELGDVRETDWRPGLSYPRVDSLEH